MSANENNQRDKQEKKSSAMSTKEQKSFERISSATEEMAAGLKPVETVEEEPEKRAKIGVLVSFHEKEFEEMITKGIRNASLYADKLGIDLVIETASPNSCLSYITALYRLVSYGVQGIVFRGIMIEELRRILRALLNKGVKMVAYNEDIAHDLRTCYVGQGTYHAGQCAANLMHLSCPDEGTILVLGDTPTHHPGMERIQGFTDYFKGLENNQLKITETVFGRGDRAYAAKMVNAQLAEHPDLKGIFVSGGGLAGVAEALEENELTGKVRVIGFDATNSNVELLRNDAVTFLIDQNPYLQGYKAVKLLADSIYYNEPIAEDVYDVGIDIVTKYNCD